MSDALNNMLDALHDLTSAYRTDVLKEAEASECRAESHTAPHGATEILRLITHGRCECDLCTSRHAK